MAKKKTLSLEQRRAVYCAVNGHSNVMTVFWGYHNCARCGEQVGDSLLGVYENKRLVALGHACDTCKTNAKLLTRRDLTYLPSEARKEVRKLQSAR